jgi:hypothetical protein
MPFTRLNTFFVSFVIYAGYISDYFPLTLEAIEIFIDFPTFIFEINYYDFLRAKSQKLKR